MRGAAPIQGVETSIDNKVDEPIPFPILRSLDFGGLFGLPGIEPADVPLWYGVIFIVDMQMAFLSPPFGYSLLPEERRTAADFDGDDLPRRGTVHLPSGNWSCPLHRLPGNYLWLPKVIYGGS